MNLVSHRNETLTQNLLLGCVCLIFRLLNYICSYNYMLFYLRLERPYLFRYCISSSILLCCYQKVPELVN